MRKKYHGDGLIIVEPTQVRLKVLLNGL